MLNGRQLAWLIYNHYKRSEAEASMTNFMDLLSIKIRGDDLNKFLSDWDHCLLGMKKQPETEVLEGLFVENVSKCSHFKETYALYKMETTHKGEARSYEKLLSICRVHEEDRRKERMR